MLNLKSKLEAINQSANNTLVEHLGILFTDANENSITATMPVDDKTVQSFRMLHGGASVVLAETLGSAASNALVQGQDKIAVGIEVNANHLASAREGTLVTGVAKAVHLGQSTHIWEIRISDESSRLLCISRLTVLIKKVEK